MPETNLIFWLVIDPITFVFGSIGAYILFAELTSYDRLPGVKDFLTILQKRKLAMAGLLIAIVYFFYRLFSVVH